MRRKLFIFCAIVSGVLCLATAGLWVLSYWKTYHIYCRFSHQRWGLGTVPEAATIEHSRIVNGHGFLDAGRCRFYSIPTDPRQPRQLRDHWTTLGWYYLEMTFHHDVPEREQRASVLFVPFWFLILVWGLLPGRLLYVIAMKWRREKRKRLGLCEQCGYDLTGNVTGMCSECGAAMGGD